MAGIDFCKLFQAMSDKKRRRILLLLQERDRCVSDLVDAFHLSQSSISKHLLILKNAGLVRNERRGQRVIYSLNGEILKDCCEEYFKRFESCHCLFADNGRKAEAKGLV